MLQPIILSGGSGTRLWPASRETYPKQLLPLVGQDSLLQLTAKRLQGLKDAFAPIVVTNEAHRFITAEQMHQAGNGVGAIILEPAGRNTAPAMQVGALVAMQGEQDPVLLVMPADHIFINTAAFLDAVVEGMSKALEGALVTFGVLPKRPETGYGYLHFGAQLASSTAHELAGFVEKPDEHHATEYVASGEYLWNAGIFMMKASVWVRALEKLNPVMAKACRDSVQGAERDKDFVRLPKDIFTACPADSIDYAVMEKVAAHPELGRALVVPLDAGWSDLGAWDALWEVSDKDSSGNSVKGRDVMLEKSENSLIYAQSRFVAAIGIKNLVVVETPDAVMVADKYCAQDVKQIVNRIKLENKALTVSHRKVSRPWGWYDLIDTGLRFQVKRIVVNPGASLSLQMHHHRAEHWIVVSGTAEVTNGEKVFILSENQSTYIPLGTAHRLANPGKLPLEIIEVQSGSYLGEDDIVRFQDTYGRT